MVKNVRPSKSSSHLSLQSATTAIDSNKQLRKSIAALKAELDALSVQTDRDVPRRAAEFVQRASQNGGMSDVLSSDHDGSRMAPGALSWNGEAVSLPQIDRPSSRQRLPRQSISSARSSNLDEAPSSLLTTLDVETHPELGMQWNEAKPKSLFEGFSEHAYAERKLLHETMTDDEKSLFQRYDELYLKRKLEAEMITANMGEWKKTLEAFNLKTPEEYTQPFCDFLTESPTVFHAVDYFVKQLKTAGFEELSEREDWNDVLVRGGKYFVSRNGSSLIAFTIGADYESGNGMAMIAGHIDALTARLKPISGKKTTAGYVQLGVAPFAGALNTTWWDRDLGIGGKVLVKDSTTGKIVTKLVKLGWPIARVPTLAPHFGIGMTGSENKETEMVPIIGLDNSDLSKEEFKNSTLGEDGSFVSGQPPRLVRAIAKELKITDFSSIVNWELELYDTQPAQTGGLDKEFIFGGRIDDKLCSWAAVQALLASSFSASTAGDSIIKLVSLFDDEEIGSLLYQGARGNFLPATVDRVVEAFTPSYSASTLSRTYANSFLISADVTHAVNPNFLGSYLENHAPRLNVGVAVHAESNGHTTTNSVSTAFLTRIAEKNGDKLQTFMIRNDSRSGGTVGPMLSSSMGVRAIDVGLPQLSMHSIRATTGSLDPGLGVKCFVGFFEHFESVDQEFA